MTDLDRIVAGLRLTGHYWKQPEYCAHNVRLEFLSASTTTGFCRACGQPMLARLKEPHP